MGLRITWITRPRGGEEQLASHRTAVAALRARGHRVRPHLTFEGGDAKRFARAAARRGDDLIIAAGGDGTINEVVNGMVRSRWQPRLGIVPAGTANDFATGLGIPEDVARAAASAVGGRAVAVDVARVNTRCFINVSTGGFGAEATESADASAKRRLGPLAYLLTGARQFAELEPVQGRFAAGGETVFDGEFLFFAVGNARQTGGGSRVTPRADRADGVLDLVVVPAMPRMEFLALLPDLRAGTHLNAPGVVYARARTIDVETAVELAVNADGEPLRGDRFRYRVASRPLSVMIPE